MSPIISAADLAMMLGNPNLIIVDCRHRLDDPAAGERAWRVASLPGAAFLHLDRDLSGPIVAGTTGRHPLPEVENFHAILTKLGLRPSSFVVAYDDLGGGIAARLWWMLRSLGHERVAVLDGGYSGWVDEGYPVTPGGVQEPGEPSDLSHLAAPQADFPRTRDRAQVADRAAEDILVDSRTAPRYRGEHEPIDPVAGHIPGAVNLPWTDNLYKGCFRTRQELKNRFATLGDEAGRVTFYCGSGVTACHNILAYYHAFGKWPLLYPGSWSEWITPQLNSGLG